jgi:hypothetical protein
MKIKAAGTSFRAFLFGALTLTTSSNMCAPLMRGCNAAVEDAVASSTTPREFGAAERADDE